MAYLKIKNFGPIKDGLKTNDGFIKLDRLTIIYGEQGSGKSAISKLYSTFLWLEKAICKGSVGLNFTREQFEELCKNQKIDKFFNIDTKLEFKSEKFHFKYGYKPYRKGVLGNDDGFSVENSNADYIRTKIVYVPSERNLLTACENVEHLKLSPMLSLFNDRYSKALEDKDLLNDFVLPIKAKYDILTKRVQIYSDKYDLPINYASSGIQSLLPLSIVSRYLSKSIEADVYKNVQSLTSFEEDNIKKKLQRKYGEDSVQDYFESFKMMKMGVRRENDIDKELIAALKSYFNRRFVNIVEEPEQNLYPDTQIKVIDELLSCLNSNELNKLIITTHSPYLIPYFALCAKCKELLNKDKKLLSKLKKIVPPASFVDNSVINIYKTDVNGNIKQLKPAYNLPSSRNGLNEALESQNEKFAKLLELEDDIDG